MAKTIQWFPGHMTKAMRDMEEKRELCDGVICVLDARAPAATLNKNLKKVFGEKPILYLLNKADLADSGADGFLKLIEEKGRACVKCNASDVSSKRTLVQKLSAMTEEKRARAEAKGLNRTFRFMVAGIPNTGKSTVVNLLSGQKRAKTGDKAGVTRDVRWLRCGTFDLLDTPGTMPPSFDNQTRAASRLYRQHQRRYSRHGRHRAGAAGNWRKSIPNISRSVTASPILRKSSVCAKHLPPPRFRLKGRRIRL
ncbi:MAG: GTPase [Christensenellaceae bacterium]